jgi:hypothetical protein
MCFAKKVDRDAFAYATQSLPPTRSECDVGEPVTEPTISSACVAKGSAGVSEQENEQENQTTFVNASVSRNTGLGVLVRYW